jgi:hypothetical protein
MMASKTHNPPIIPTSTHGKILHSIFPSEAAALVGSPVEKKSSMHFDLAVEWREAETMIQAAAIANTASVAVLCNDTYRRYNIGFSYKQY